ncbi:MAG: hypothetical protein JXB45_11070 [Candidatus Krumholzibacteriota bacterium]|nr:hypothetical protein [Candidatus Krumholzibacteriota bacterium]
MPDRINSPGMQRPRKIDPGIKAGIKNNTRIKMAIKKALRSGAKTIPQISAETSLPPDQITYHLMCMRKFGEIQAGDPDDRDEYYYYELKKDK